LQTDGRVFYWFLAPGFCDGAVQGCHLIEELSRISVRSRFLAGSGPVPVQKSGANHPLVRGLPDTLGNAAADSEVFLVSDPLACPIGYIEEISKEGAVAVRQFPSFTSVYSAVPGNPWQLLRNAALLAGVHLYTRDGIVVYANSHFLCLNISFTGCYSIRLRHPRRLVDCFTREVVHEKAEHVRLMLETGAHLYWLEE